MKRIAGYIYNHKNGYIYYIVCSALQTHMKLWTHTMDIPVYDLDRPYNATSSHRYVLSLYLDRDWNTKIIHRQQQTFDDFFFFE